MKTLLVAGMAVLALSALGASSAAATVVPAKFSSSWFEMSSSGITVKRNGTEAKTCTASSIEASTEGNSYFGSNDFPSGGVRFNCTGGGSLVMGYVGTASYDTVTGKYTLQNKYSSPSYIESPWGPYLQSGTQSGAWVNGSGSTASKVTYTNQTIGFTYPGNQKITIEGSLKANEFGGGLVTLSH